MQFILCIIIAILGTMVVTKPIYSIMKMEYRKLNAISSRTINKSAKLYYPKWGMCTNKERFNG